MGTGKRLLLVAGLVSVNVFLARGLFAQGTGCDATCTGFKPSCIWISTGGGTGNAQACYSISGPYSCGGDSCGERPS